MVNLLLFLVGFLPGGTYEGVAITMEQRLLLLGGLWPIDSPFFWPWQFFTYMFLHGGFLHIFFNMLVLFMFGVELEQIWGSRRFVIYYLACGIGAGMIHAIVTYLMGNEAPTVGASGAIMGVMVAFGMIFPDRIIYFNLFFPMKAKYAVLLFVGIDLVFGFGAAQGDNVARFAHIGGALVGFILLKVGGRMTLGGIFDRRTPRVTEAPRQRAPIIEARFRESEPARPSVPSMNFGDEQERIDAILDKISRSGYQTLTEEEKAILLEASRRMR